MDGEQSGEGGDERPEDEGDPTPLGGLLAPLVIRADAQVRLDRARIASSAGIAAFTTPHDDRPAWVDAGRSYERFALRADQLRLRNAFINEPIEVPDLRPHLEATIATPGHVQLLVRFGYAPYAPYSLRRPVDEVTTADAHP